MNFELLSKYYHFGPLIIFFLLSLIALIVCIGLSSYYKRKYLQESGNKA